MKPPELPDFTLNRITTDEFIATLNGYLRVHDHAIWVVRWHGRIRPIAGMCFFETRAQCQSRVQAWLRDAGRYSTGRLVRYSGLPGNWGRKKAYKTFIDALVVQLEQTGVLEYVQLQPAGTETLAPIGLQTLTS